MNITKKRRTLFYSSFVCVFNFFFQNLLFSIVREQVLWYVFHYLIFQIVACLFVWLNKSFNVFFNISFSLVHLSRQIYPLPNNEWSHVGPDWYANMTKSHGVCVHWAVMSAQKSLFTCVSQTLLWSQHNKTSHRLKCAQPVQLDDFKPLNVCHFEYCYFVKTRNQKRRVSRLVLAMDRFHTITNIDYHKQIV